MATRYRRRKVLVDRAFQIGMTVKVLACLAAYMLLFGLMAVFGPFLTVLAGSASEAEILKASQELQLFGRNIIIPVLLVFACMCLHCILISHKIAGPVYRLRQVLKGIRAGDLTQHVRLRDGDYLQDLGESLDDTLTCLREDIFELQGRAEELSELVDGVANEASSVPDDMMGALVEKRDRLLELLAQYGTTEIEVGEPPVGDDDAPEDTEPEETQPEASDEAPDESPDEAPDEARVESA